MPYHTYAPSHTNTQTLIPFQGTVSYKTELVTVDSIHVASSLRYTESNYKVFFKTPFKNVKRIDLICCQVPFILNNIIEGKNIFTVEETYFDGNANVTQTIHIPIPEGHYSESELLFDIERLLNVKSPGGGGYKVYFLRPRGKIVMTFTNSDIVSFIVKSTELAKSLGFTTDKDSTVPITTEDVEDVLFNNAVMTDRYINISGPGYLFLECQELQNTYRSLSYDNKNTLNDGAIFAKITASTPAGTYLYYNHMQDYPIFKEFEPKLLSIDSLSFRWLDVEGKEVDFHGLDHSFTLMFTCEEYRSI